MSLRPLTPLHPLVRFRHHAHQTPWIDRRSFSGVRSRLSQRIALAVFTSIVAIEAVILVPSVFRHERELLTQLSDQSTASVMGVLAALDAAADEPGAEPLGPEQFLARLSPLQTLPFIAGGTLYYRTGTKAGQAVGSFGSLPRLTYEELDSHAQGTQLYRRQRRYDSAWVISATDDYLIIICHDTTGTRQAVIAFIGRIAVLVLIISAVVTLATMITLRPLLIAPVLALRNDLRQAASAALREQTPLFSSLVHRRDDELGEVIQAFEQMYTHITGAIAQRRRAEVRLRESESRFRVLVEQAAESIFVLAQDGRVLDMNQFALRHLHYSAEDISDLSIFEIDPDLTPEMYQDYWQKLQVDNSLTIETNYRPSRGPLYPVEVRSSLINKGGQQQLLCLVRDIRDRKKAQAAQARLAEIGQLAAMIVHEVRNPLATIYMALSGFQRLKLPRSGQLRLELALEEAERLKRLLNEILAYSRENRLKGERIELNGLCKELFQSLQQLPTVCDRQVRLMICPENVVVEGDRDKLKQVFINLVTNACEAIDIGESVTWTIRSIASINPANDQNFQKQRLQRHDLSNSDLPALGTQVSGSQVQGIQIEVRNGGEPIPADVLPKLTQPFVSTKESGNGLGLAITKRIVEAHGGHLAIASNAVEGTRVTVTLPQVS